MYATSSTPPSPSTLQNSNPSSTSPAVGGHETLQVFTLPRQSQTHSASMPPDAQALARWAGNLERIPLGSMASPLPLKDQHRIENSLWTMEDDRDLPREFQNAAAILALNMNQPDGMRQFDKFRQLVRNESLSRAGNSQEAVMQLSNATVFPPGASNPQGEPARLNLGPAPRMPMSGDAGIGAEHAVLSSTEHSKRQRVGGEFGKLPDIASTNTSFSTPPLLEPSVQPTTIEGGRLPWGIHYDDVIKPSNAQSLQTPASSPRVSVQPLLPQLQTQPLQMPLSVETPPLPTQLPQPSQQAQQKPL